MKGEINHGFHGFAVIRSFPEDYFMGMAGTRMRRFF